MKIIENIALISINETLFVQLISFLIFLFIINRIMFRPLEKVMHDRNKYIDDMKQNVENAKDKMNLLMSQLNEREKQAKEEAFILQKKLEDAGSLEASKMFAETRKDVEKHAELVHQEVQQQIMEAKKQFSKESEMIASTIMEKVLNRRIAL